MIKNTVYAGTQEYPDTKSNKVTGTLFFIGWYISICKMAFFLGIYRTWLGFKAKKMSYTKYSMAFLA